MWLYDQHRFTLRRCHTDDHHFIFKMAPVFSENSATEAQPHLGEVLTTTTPYDEVHTRFKRTLERTFGRSDSTTRIMSCIDCWTDGLWVPRSSSDPDRCWPDQWLNSLEIYVHISSWSDDMLREYLIQALWGYPELLRKFYTEIRPLLIDLRRSNIGLPLLEEIRIPPLDIEIPV